MLCWEEDCLEGPLLTPPSLLESLPQPPSAELFHYDSTNAVNWGMRGEAVGQQAGWGASGCRGAAAPLQAAPEMGSRPEGQGQRWGGPRSPGGGCWWEWLMSLVFLCPTEYKVRWLPGVTATWR